MNAFNKKTKFITTPEFSTIEHLNIYHLEDEDTGYSHPENLRNIHIKVRRKFSISDIAKGYKIRFSAADYAKVYINGKKVGQGPCMGYDFCYYFNEYELDGYLTEGENIIEAEVYYQGLISHASMSGALKFGFIGEILNNDGECILSTDESWEYTTENCFSIQSVIRGYDTQYIENYDARVKDGDYSPVAIRDMGYTYSDVPTVNLEEYEISPIRSEVLENGAIFYDFGKEITATLKLTAKGNSGSVIRILQGEECDGGEYRVRYNMRCNCVYEEFFTLGEGVSSLREFDYKAFRYATLVPEEDVEILSFTASVRHYPMKDDACVFETDNEKLSAIFEMCKNGVKCGSQEIYVDCPQREKGQYAGDMTVTSLSQIYLSGDLSLFKKALDNQLQSAFICPGIMAVTPSAAMQEIADYSLQLPILALRHYEFSGDKEYLGKCLDVCKDMIKYFEKYEREDGLLESVKGKWNLVDWPSEARDGYDFTLTKPVADGTHNVINAFYIGAVLLTEKMQDILSIKHEKKSKSLIDAFNREFLDTESGLYKDTGKSSHFALHSSVLPLFYGFAPESSVDKICDFIMKKRLSCGVYFSFFMLKALCRAGRVWDAYSLIISEDECSWYNMVREGATSCFEAWGKDKKKNTSLCHPWASTPISVLIENIIPKYPELAEVKTKIFKKHQILI